VPGRFQRVTPVVALIVAVLAASAIMISHITDWTMALAVGDIALLLPATAVLISWIIRHW
jgi:hypothetical protein